MKIRTIAYPFAQDADGVATSIDNAKHDVPYTCVGCGEPMIPKLGRIKKHHFAHKMNVTCDADHALHESAKIYIIEKFNKAVQSGGVCVIPVPCSCCRQTIKHDLTAGGTEIRPEVTVIEGTRSDLAVLKSASLAHAIIEVVVTHDLEPQTHRAYQKSSIPVIVLKPTWDNMNIIERTMNIVCKACAVRERDLKSFMPRIAGSKSPPRLITHDKFGARLIPKTGSTLNGYAYILRGFGFEQQNSRPTLFLYETKHWRVYADLDSTKIMRIWEVNCEAGVYARAKHNLDEKDCHPDCQDCVEKTARERIRDAGVPTRRYFLNQTYHWHGVPDHT